MSQIIYKGKKGKTTDAYGDGRFGKVVTLFEFGKQGIKMINGDEVVSVQ